MICKIVIKKGTLHNSRTVPKEKCCIIYRMEGVHYLF